MVQRVLWVLFSFVSRGLKVWRGRAGLAWRRSGGVRECVWGVEVEVVRGGVGVEEEGVEDAVGRGGGGIFDT